MLGLYIVWFLLLNKSLKCLKRYLLLLIFVMVAPKISIQRSRSCLAWLCICVTKPAFIWDMTEESWSASEEALVFIHHTFNHCHCSLDFVVETGLKKVVSKTHQEIPKLYWRFQLPLKKIIFWLSFWNLLIFQPYIQSLFHSEEALQRKLGSGTDRYQQVSH